MNQSEIKANTSNKHYSQSMSCLDSICEFETNIQNSSLWIQRIKQNVKQFASESHEVIAKQ